MSHPFASPFSLVAEFWVNPHSFIHQIFTERILGVNPVLGSGKKRSTNKNHELTFYWGETQNN